MKTFPFLFASLLLSSAAFANPVMIVQELSAQVVAGPHVKLTLTYNYGGSDVTTHGTSHSPWASAGSTSRDTGSGVKELPILRMCDCHVPTASTLDYRIGNYGSPSSATQVSVPEQSDLVTGDDCKRPCQQADADAVDAGQTSATGGAMGAGGTAATGAGGTAATGGAMGAGGTAATGGTMGAGGTAASGGTVGAGGTNLTGGGLGAGGTTATGGALVASNKPKGSGCAVAAPGTSATTLYLALLGIAIAAWRRRR
jgi:MYXO-CTERM domain-containing protein